MTEITERSAEAREAYSQGYEAGKRDGLAAAYRGLVHLSPEQHTAMLSAASAIPLEHENGGLEYPPFKVFKAMLMAYIEAQAFYDPVASPPHPPAPPSEG